jgi:uncharacterized protein with HEPN domain
VNRNDKKRIEDILEFATKLSRYVAKGFDEFRAEEGSGLAIERLIELIGEASSHLSEEYKTALPTVEWKDIAGMRVLLAHAYHRVDFEDIRALDSCNSFSSQSSDSYQESGTLNLEEESPYKPESLALSIASVVKTLIAYIKRRKPKAAPTK